MADKARPSTHGHTEIAVDITSAVHSRMVPDSVLEVLAATGTLGEKENNIVFRRLFRSLREEAQFWFLASGERGAVICSAERIEYVPERHFATFFQAGKKEAELTAAIRCYRPLVEAVVVIATKGFCKTVIAGEEDFPDGLCS